MTEEQWAEIKAISAKGQEWADRGRRESGSDLHKHLFALACNPVTYIAIITIIVVSK